MQRSARIVKTKEKYAYGMQIEAKRMRINETIEKTKKKLFDSKNGDKANCLQGVECTHTHRHTYTPITRLQVSHLLHASMVMLKQSATRKTAFTRAPNTSARAQPKVFFDHFFGDICGGA